MVYSIHMLCVVCMILCSNEGSSFYSVGIPTGAGGGGGGWRGACCVFQHFCRKLN